MAELVGTVTQDPNNSNKITIKGQWNVIGTPALKSPFTYTSLDGMDPVRCGHASDTLKVELPGTGEYAGTFTMANPTGPTEHQEKNVLLKCTKHRNTPERFITVKGTGSNEFGKFSITGTIELSTQEFKVIKNYIVPGATSAPSPRSGGSGRIRKKKRPYSPPNVPKPPPKIRKISAKPPAAATKATADKKEETDTDGGPSTSEPTSNATTTPTPTNTTTTTTTETAVPEKEESDEKEDGDSEEKEKKPDDKNAEVAEKKEGDDVKKEKGDEETKTDKGEEGKKKEKGEEESSEEESGKEEGR